MPVLTTQHGASFKQGDESRTTKGPNRGSVNIPLRNPMHATLSLPAQASAPAVQSTEPLFSVVITTRNRPAVFAAALDSVLAQSHGEHEVVVVEDGSDPELRPAYDQLLAQARKQHGLRVRALHLLRRPRGHGSGYVMNVGVEAARGRYVTFLDDDDLWVDADHLSRAAQVIRQAETAGQALDLYCTNQEAVHEDRHRTQGWLWPLQQLLRASRRASDALGSFPVDAADLVQLDSFCHVNCLVVRRDLYLACGGRDETLRWEGDHNLFLRLVDQAQHIRHFPGITALHHVPQQRSSVTTRLGPCERRLAQAQSMHRAAELVRSPVMRARAQRVEAHALKHATQALSQAGDWAQAASLAWRALRLQPRAKWAAFAVYCQLMRWRAGTARA